MNLDSTVFLVSGVVLAVLVVLAFASWRLEAHRRMEFAFQAAVVTVAWLAYFLVRGFTEGDVAAALQRAEAIADLERRLGIHIEPALNEFLARSDVLVTAGNLVYIWGHWPLILVVALWLFGRHPHEFHLYKRAFLISGAIGLAFFFTLPTAPPRLAHEGLLDSVSEYSQSYRVLQPALLTNQYAAFPSLHVGWNLLIGIALFRNAGARSGRLLGLVSPVAMAFAAVATANHYIVDIVAGAGVALAGLALASEPTRTALGRRVRRATGTAPARSPQEAVEGESGGAAEPSNRA